MVGGIQPPPAEVEPDPRGHFVNECLLFRNGIVPFQDRVVGPLPRADTVLHERHDRAAQPVETLGHRRPAGARFVVIHQRVVGIAIGQLAGGLLPLEGEDPLEPGGKFGPRGFGPGRSPGLLALDAGFGKLLDQPRGQPGLLVVVVLEQPDGRDDVRGSVSGEWAVG